ncbi:hypothetical protein EI94DRAFT_1801113 [Lactarius quietus]|nr:hypothetical protein EI94DRAFT_1801113 [Lactarius quietus]
MSLSFHPQNEFISFVESPPSTGHYIALATILITPTSRGSITLASANPFDAPNIDPAFLSSNFDIFTIREGIKAALRFAAAPSVEGLRDRTIRSS